MTAPGRGHINVILALTDDGRYDYIKAAGRNGLVEIPGTTEDIIHEVMTTKGTMFPQFRNVLPWCGPSRATLLTGQNAMHNGVSAQGVGNDGYMWDRALFKDLHDGGVQTGVIGKISNWLLGDMVGCPNFTPGTHYADGVNVKDPSDPLGTRIWTCILSYTAGSTPPHSDTTHWRYPVLDGVDFASIGETGQKRWDHWVETFDENGCARGDNTNGDAHIFSWSSGYDWSADHNSRMVCEMIDAFIDRPKDDPRYNTPFFIMCNFHDPHGPNQSMPPIPVGDPNKRSIRANFYRDGDPDAWPVIDPDTYIPPHFQDGGYPNIDLVTTDPELIGDAMNETLWALTAEVAIDDGMKLIVDHLRDRNILENTVVIFIDGDNGQFRGEHGEWSGKQSMYDDDMKTTCIIRGPGFPAGKVCDQPIFNLDINYTIRSIMGVDPDTGANGASDVDADIRDVVNGKHDLRNRFMLVYSSADAQYGAMWGRKWKYFRETTTYHLYDLENDPYELNNVYDSSYPGAALAQSMLKPWQEGNMFENDPGKGGFIHYEAWPPGVVGGIDVEDVYIDEDPVHDP